jgi:transcriptional regulator with XRE-family HTH domain
MLTMPKPSTLKLPPLDTGPEKIGHRLVRLRKERGYTQVELAKKMGIIQQLVTAYEKDKLRLHAEMVIRFADALEVTTDEILLGTHRATKKTDGKLSFKLVRRLQKIEKLPSSQQKSLLQTIDMVLKASGLSS